MSIRPLHKFVNWSLHCWVLGDWLAASCLLQASNYTRLFYYLAVPLTPRTLFSTYSFLQSLLPERAGTSQILEIPAVCLSHCKNVGCSTGRRAVLVSVREACDAADATVLKNRYQCLSRLVDVEMPCYDTPYIYIYSSRERGGGE